jgi:hypothetical protein
MDIAASPSLVVVRKVDIKGIALVEAEDDPPVPRVVTLQNPLRSPFNGWRCQPHVTRLLGRIEGGEHVRDLFDLAGGNAAAVVVFKQALQPHHVENV